MRALIVDTETTGFESEDEVIEIAAVVYDLNHKAMTSAWSTTLQTERPNGAFEVNGIPDGIGLTQRSSAATHLSRLAMSCSVIVAHNAEFDRGWLPEIASCEWVCSFHDMVWPVRPGKLVEMALAMGLGVASAHRALDDCLTLVRMMDRLGETRDLREWMDECLVRAREPKLRVVANVPFAQREMPKAAGFRWDAQAKQWWKQMRASELAAATFEFPVRDYPMGGGHAR